MAHEKVTAAQFAALEGLADWRVVLDEIQASFDAESFLSAAALASVVAQLAHQADHHPDVDLRYPGLVRIALTTHAAGGLTTLDVDLAARSWWVLADADGNEACVCTWQDHGPEG